MSGAALCPVDVLVAPLCRVGAAWVSASGHEAQCLGVPSAAVVGEGPERLNCFAVMAEASFGADEVPAADEPASPGAAALPCTKQLPSVLDEFPSALPVDSGDAVGPRVAVERAVDVDAEAVQATGCFLPHASMPRVGTGNMDKLGSC